MRRAVGSKMLKKIQENEENTGKQDGNAFGIRVGFEQGSQQIFENKSEWLTTAEAAVYLRKTNPGGMPSINAVHKMVSQGRIRRRKFAGRLYFRRKELDYLIETSEA